MRHLHLLRYSSTASKEGQGTLVLRWRISPSSTRLLWWSSLRSLSFLAWLDRRLTSPLGNTIDGRPPVRHWLCFDLPGLTQLSGRCIWDLRRERHGGLELYPQHLWRGITICRTSHVSKTRHPLGDQSTGVLELGDDDSAVCFHQIRRSHSGWKQILPRAQGAKARDGGKGAEIKQCGRGLHVGGDWKWSGRKEAGSYSRCLKPLYDDSLQRFWSPSIGTHKPYVQIIHRMHDPPDLDSIGHTIWISRFSSEFSILVTFISSPNHHSQGLN